MRRAQKTELKLERTAAHHRQELVSWDAQRKSLARQARSESANDDRGVICGQLGHQTDVDSRQSARTRLELSPVHCQDVDRLSGDAPKTLCP